MIARPSCFRNGITRMVPLAHDAMKILANFAPTSWPGLTRPSSHNLKYPVFFWMAASKGGHDDGIGGNIRVIKFLNKPLPIALWRRVRRGARATGGTVLIEAAIILPVLAMIFLGMIEFSLAFTAKRRVQNVASATADLVAQSATVTTANLNDIASIGAQLMLPFSSTGLALTITSVAEDAQSNITVQWSCSWSSLSSSANCTASGAAYKGLPSGLLSPGKSVIIGQTSYPYKPTIGEFLTGGLTFSSASYYRPRLVASVAKQ